MADFAILVAVASVEAWLAHAALLRTPHASICPAGRAGKRQCGAAISPMIEFITKIGWYYFTSASGRHLVGRR
jgi:hypothetical protein